MKNLTLLFVVLALSLTACGDMGWVTAAPDIYRITPSRPPTILTRTPAITYPTTSATLPPPPSLTPSLTLVTDSPPTFTVTPTNIETSTASPTFTVIPPPLTVTLLGCDTGFDVTHGMGEVTNAYVTLVNASGPDLTTVCATLSAADEGRLHPDKLICIPSLPGGYQVTLKLTIDTTFQVNTIVGVAVTSNEGILANASGLACGDIGAFKPAPDTIGVLQPIQ